MKYGAIDEKKGSSETKLKACAKDLKEVHKKEFALELHPGGGGGFGVVP